MCVGLARVEERLRAERVLRDAYIQSLVNATELAKESMEFRLEGMNEFREQLREQTSRFPTREEIDAQLNPILQDLRVLRESRAELQGKASQGAVNIVLLLALLSLTVGVLGILMRFV